MPSKANRIDQQYFTLMNNISGNVSEYIKNKIITFCHLGDFSRNIELFEYMMQLPDARRGKNIFRSLLTDLIYKNLDGKKVDIIPILALSELNNINGYLDNWILDDKKNIWSSVNAREKISYITLASGIFRELIEDVAGELPVNADSKLKILKVLSDAMVFSYQGQALDLKMVIDKNNNYSNIDEYLKEYIEKSFLQSGCLYGASTKIGAIAAGANDEQTELAKIIGETIGTGLHISNDLGDFALMGENEGDFKNYQDQMADLKNGRLTLPSYYVLKFGNNAEISALRKIIGNNKATLKDKITAAKTLHSSGAYDYCKKIIRKYHNNAKQLIGQLPDNYAKQLLDYSPVVIRSNKYLTELRKIM